MAHHRNKARYLAYESISRGVFPNLEDVLQEVRKHYPGASVEGSAGFERMYLDQTRLLVAMAWSSGRKADSPWGYVVFASAHEW